MSEQGKILKNLIRGKGLKTEVAAVMLGVSRQTLSTYFGKSKLSDDVLQNVKTKLKIDVNNPDYKPPESDTLRCQQLERELDTANKRIRDLEKLVNLYEKEIENLQKVADLPQLKNKQSTTKSIVK